MNDKAKSKYELAVEKYFGLPDDVSEYHKITTDVGDLCALLCFFDESPALKLPAFNNAAFVYGDDSSSVEPPPPIDLGHIVAARNSIDWDRKKEA